MLGLIINAANTTYFLSAYYIVFTMFADKIQCRIRQQRRNANRFGEESLVDMK